MNKNNLLPDTPWHVGYVKKEEGDPRRHKLRCIHLDGGKCKSTDCVTYLRKCPGSSHCDCYAENQMQDEANKLRKKTIEQETDERSKDYRSMVTARAKRLMKEDRLCFSDLHFNRIDCPVCRERFKRVNAGEERNRKSKTCMYCGAVFKRWDKAKPIPEHVEAFFIFE